jgi:hypothetical protein
MTRSQLQAKYPLGRCRRLRRAWIFSERITFYPAGAVRKGTGTTAYAWFVWDKDASEGTKLKWFKPGYKAKYPDGMTRCAASAKRLRGSGVKRLVLHESGLDELRRSSRRESLAYLDEVACSFREPAV